MTRRWVPGTSRETGEVWEWVCDYCPTRSPEVARRHDDLPSVDEMRARGWFIAKVHGDRCPSCVTPDPTPEGDPR